MFFGIITLIAYLGITYAVICSLTISTIAMYFFPDKLSILFAEDPYDCTNTSSNNNYFTTPRNQSLFMTPGYGHRYTYGFTQTPGLYRQPCYTPMPMSTPNTSTPQTPPDLSFDTNLIGMYRNNDNNSNASADQVSLLTTKYKSAAMSYGDPNSDAYIRMSENVSTNTVTSRSFIYFLICNA